MQDWVCPGGPLWQCPAGSPSGGHAGDCQEPSRSPASPPRHNLRVLYSSCSAKPCGTKLAARGRPPGTRLWSGSRADCQWGCCPWDAGHPQPHKVTLLAISHAMHYSIVGYRLGIMAAAPAAPVLTRGALPAILRDHHSCDGPCRPAAADLSRMVYNSGQLKVERRLPPYSKNGPNGAYIVRMTMNFE